MTERFSWSEDKSHWLSRERGVTFVDVVVAIRNRRLALIDNPNQDEYPGQCLFIVEISDYGWAVPASKTAEGWFLHTAYPSRAMTLRYFRKDSRK